MGLLRPWPRGWKVLCHQIVLECARGQEIPDLEDDGSFAVFFLLFNKFKIREIFKLIQIFEQTSFTNHRSQWNI